MGESSGLSLAQQVKRLPPAEQQVMLQAMATQAGIDIQVLAKSLIHDWRFWGRPSQFAPEGNWTWWALITGRRFGKTRTAAEWVHQRVDEMPKTAASTGGLLQRTIGEVRDKMVEGPSGLLATAKPGRPVTWEPSKRRVTFHNGYSMTCFTSEEPDGPRGDTLSTAWCDEFAALRTHTGIGGLSAFDNLRIALSAPVPGDRPRGVITTTPRRVKTVKEVLAEAALGDGRTVLTKGSLMDNVDNLDAATVEDLVTRYAGTTLGAQELDGELISDVEGSSFKTAWFYENAIESIEDCPSFGKTVIAVDPSSGDGTGDACGIMALALSAAPIPTSFEHKGLTVVQNLHHVYVLEDGTLNGPPDVWARQVDFLGTKWGTTTVVAEGNQGGQMVSSVIRNVNPALRVKIVHAKHGKVTRAEPVGGVTQQNRVHLVGSIEGDFQELVDECTTYVSTDTESPDHMDAFVWGVTHLLPGLARKGEVKMGNMDRRIG